MSDGQEALYRVPCAAGLVEGGSAFERCDKLSVCCGLRNGGNAA